MGGIFQSIFALLLILPLYALGQDCNPHFSEIAKNFLNGIYEEHAEDSLLAFSGKLRREASDQPEILKFDFLSEALPFLVYDYESPQLINDLYAIVKKQEQGLIRLAQQDRGSAEQMLAYFNQNFYQDLGPALSLSFIRQIEQSRLMVGVTEVEAIPLIEAIAVSYTNFTVALPIDESSSDLYHFRGPSVSGSLSYHHQNLLLDLHGISQARAHRARVFLSFIWRHFEHLAKETDAGERWFGNILHEAKVEARDLAGLRGLQERQLIFNLNPKPSLQARIERVDRKLKSEELPFLETLSELSILELFVPLESDGLTLYQRILVRNNPVEIRGLANFLAIDSPYFYFSPPRTESP